MVGMGRGDAMGEIRQRAVWGAGQEETTPQPLYWSWQILHKDLSLSGVHTELEQDRKCDWRLMA